MIGIGGIGMSALAQLYLAEGNTVTGSDRDHSPTTDMLEKLGVAINYGQAIAKVPADADLVVYSDAIPESHIERAQARELRKQQASYFHALGVVSRNRRTIAVSGTHGKTTTTAMLTKILSDAGKKPTAIIGSIVRDFDSNFVLGTESPFVVEACEYRDHLLELSPEVLIITNVEWDHTDWFHTEADMIQTFHRAALKVPEYGTIVADVQAPHMAEVLEGVTATIIDYRSVDAPETHLIGEFNKMNARAAVAAATASFPDIDTNALRESLYDFQGTWRRFEFKGQTKEGMLVFDDYAHHPTAIRETLKAARDDSRIQGRRIITVFHPHLYSRTRDLMEDFSQAFKYADEVILAPIYAAREDPIPDVTSDVLAQKIELNGTPARALKNFDEIANCIRGVASGDVCLITMGAGDVYKVADELVG